MISLTICCATGSVVLTGEKGTPIPAEDVKVYIDAPRKYTTIGLVEAKSEVEFSGQAARDRAIKKLKAKAGKLGANGVILLSSGERSGGMSGTFVSGVFIGSDSEYKTVSGKAIFVEEE